MKTTAILTATLGLALSSLHAQNVPLGINYQGKVTDSAGLGLGTGTPINRKMLFRIYNAPTGAGAARLWTEEQTVTISNGEFSVILGKGINPTGTASSEVPRPALDTVFTSLSPSTSDRYLGVTVDNGDNSITAADVEIVPRQQLTSTAYTLRAGAADSIPLNSDLKINNSADYGLGWYGTGRPFSGITVNGPVLYGQGGGALGSAVGATKNIALRWDANTNVTVGGTLTATSFSGSFSGASGTLTGLLSGNTGTFSGTLAANGGLNGTFGTFTGALTGTTGAFTGALNAATFSGNGAALTALNATNVSSGTLNDARLSTNVALLNRASQAFTGATNTFSQNVGIGAATAPATRLQVTAGGSALPAATGTAQSFGHMLRLKDNTANLALDVGGAGTSGFWLQSADPTDLATQKPLLLNPNGGSVGIGTSSPSTNFEVSNGTTQSGIRATGYGGGGGIFDGRSARGTNAAPTALQNGNFLAFFGGRGYGTTAFSSSMAAIDMSATENWTDTAQGTSMTFGTTANGTTTRSSRMKIDQNGNVGIGTTTPTKGKLEVTGTVDAVNLVSQYLNKTAYSYINGGGNGDAYVPILNETAVAGVAHNVSIYASADVAATGFAAFSDARIKRIERRSDAVIDLTTLLGIEVTDYTYIDAISKGAGMQKKVIAQQVEKVYPQAVKKSTDVVPDIYKKATVKDGWVALATELKLGERVRLIGEQEEAIHEVLEVREGAFRTAFQPATEAVFVYGREVKDFRSVDYEAIAMLNVSATQQIKKEKDAEVKALQQENSELRNRVAALEAKDKARDAKMASIEKLLGSPEQPATRTISLKQGE